jgi:hypothetical protein
MPQFSLSFWPEGPTVSKQLKEQGYKFDKATVKKFEQRVDYINKSLTCGELSHADAFNTAKALADEIIHHIQTYVEPVVEVVAEPVKPAKKKATKKAATKKAATKKPVKKAATKKASNDKNGSKKASGKSKRS